MRQEPDGEWKARHVWNSFKTDENVGITAETITIAGGGGDSIHAYVARPPGDGPFPGIVVFHHMPGWDEFSHEFVERFARHGYEVICPDLYCRYGHGTPDDVAAKVRSQGGVHDDAVLADAKGAIAWLKDRSTHNGKVGVIGTCSGGRHAFLAAARLVGVDAIVDLWGGGVVAKPEDATPARPVAPLEYTKDISAPLLGIFGNDDQSPTPEAVDILEAELKKHGKTYTFHRYDGAGHGFFYYQGPAYRPEQAMDAWGHVFRFFADELEA